MEHSYGIIPYIFEYGANTAVLLPSTNELHALADTVVHQRLIKSSLAASVFPFGKKSFAPSLLSFVRGPFFEVRKRKEKNSFQKFLLHALYELIDMQIFVLLMNHEMLASSERRKCVSPTEMQFAKVSYYNVLTTN